MYWQKAVQWEIIQKVCFKSFDYGAPDFIYLFVVDEEGPYIIPISEGRDDPLWTEIKERGLFPSRLEIKADTGLSQFHCWPST